MGQYQTGDTITALKTFTDETGTLTAATIGTCSLIVGGTIDGGMVAVTTPMTAEYQFTVTIAGTYTGRQDAAIRVPYTIGGVSAVTYLPVGQVGLVAATCDSADVSASLLGDFLEITLTGDGTFQKASVAGIYRPHNVFNGYLRWKNIASELFIRYTQGGGASWLVENALTNELFHTASGASFVGPYTPSDPESAGTLSGAVKGLPTVDANGTDPAGTAALAASLASDTGVARQSSLAGIPAGVWGYLTSAADALADTTMGKWIRTLLGKFRFSGTAGQEKVIADAAVSLTPEEIAALAADIAAEIPPPNVLPGFVSAQGGMVNSLLPAAWQNSYYSVTFPVIAKDGSPINLSGIALTMDFWTQNNPDTAAFSAATAGNTHGTISISGTNHNMLTLTLDKTCLEQTGSFIGLLRPTADDQNPFTSASLTIQAAPPV